MTRNTKLWALIGVLAVTGLALAMIVAFVTPPPRSTASATDTPQSGGEEEVFTPSLIDVPAIDFIGTVIGTGGVRNVPTPKCVTQTPAAAVTVGSTTIYVFTAGYGGIVETELGACGEEDVVEGVRVIHVGDKVGFTAGDVLVTADAKGVGGLHDRVLGGLEEFGCADLSPTPNDATRNPSDPEYSRYTQGEAVRISGEGPDVGPQALTPTLLDDPGLGVLPVGVVGPPAPEWVDRPAQLEWPGPEPTLATAQIPVEDVVGPGCGWLFTGVVPPSFDAALAKREGEALLAATELALQDAQVQWRVEAEAYLGALPKFRGQAARWNSYALKASDVAWAWAEQRRLLDVYEAEVEVYNEAVEALQAWETRRRETQEAFDAQVLACEETVEGAQSGRPPLTQPGQTPAECPPQEPPILTEQPPTLPPKPTKPKLWAPT